MTSSNVKVSALPRSCFICVKNQPQTNSKSNIKTDLVSFMQIYRFIFVTLETDYIYKPINSTNIA